MTNFTSRVESPSCAHMIIDGREILNFGGSSYLGLSNHPAIIEAGISALRVQGASCQLPRHYGVALSSNLQAEAEAREFFGFEDSIYFSTGYMFGSLAFTGLADQYEIAIIDEHGHYNLFDGARAAEKPIATFRHCDPQHLKEVLERECADGARPMVATDGMFATFGDSPPLDLYSELIERYGGWLAVDESHSFGCLGQRGAGACEQFGIQGPNVIAGGSMGKAFSAHGGLAVGSRSVISAMWKSPAARGSVSGTSVGAAMTAAAIKVLREEPKILQKLQGNAQLLKNILSNLGLHPIANTSPISAFVLRSPQQMRRLQKALMTEGIFVIHSSYVGTSPGGAIRIAAFADHCDGDFRRLENALQEHL